MMQRKREECQKRRLSPKAAPAKAASVAIPKPVAAAAPKPVQQLPPVQGYPAHYGPVEPAVFGALDGSYTEMEAQAAFLRSQGDALLDASQSWFNYSEELEERGHQLLQAADRVSDFAAKGRYGKGVAWQEIQALLPGVKGGKFGKGKPAYGPFGKGPYI